MSPNPITLQSSRARRPVNSRFTLVTVTLVIAIGVIVVSIVSGPRYWKHWSYQPQEGDIIMQSLPTNPLVRAIENGTHSPWSHCGIVAFENGHWVVHEAYACVEATSLKRFLFRSRDEQYAVYRLRPEYRQHIPQVLQEVRKFSGRPYDAKYEMDDEKIYCSELIYKAFRNVTGEPLGKTVQLGELNWKPFTAVIEKLEGGPPPLDREMITPRDLAAAHQLELVTSSNYSRPPDTAP